MAPTISNLNRVDENLMVNILDWTWDATYPAGGEVVTPNAVGMGTVLAVIPLGSSGGACANYVASTGKLMAYYADYSTTTDGLLIEIAVGDTAILSGVVQPLMVIGY